MPPLVSSALVLGLGGVVLWGMVSGWRHRTARTTGLVPVLPDIPAAGARERGVARTAALEAAYVSTTTAGDWLDRVTAHDLGLPGPAVVQVFDSGVLVERQGATDLFLPADALRAAGTTTGMAGKFVGGASIVVLTWEAPGGVAGPGTWLDSGVRTRLAADRGPLVDATTALIETHGRGERPARQEEDL